MEKEPSTPAPKPTSPQKEETSSGWGAWSNWVSNPTTLFTKVKEQSESLINIYKEDIQEFTKSIQSDTTEILKTTIPAVAPDHNNASKGEGDEQSLASQITANLSNLFGFVSQQPKKEEGQQPQKPVIVDRRLARIATLQQDLSTYCTDPAAPSSPPSSNTAPNNNSASGGNSEIADDFNYWRKHSFKLNEKTDEISKLLATNDKMREIHMKLVPVVVTYNDFWERYYYKLYKLEQEEERRAALVKKATNIEDEEELAWDLDDDEDSKLESVPITPTAEKIPDEKEVEEYFEKLDVNKSEETLHEGVTGDEANSNSNNNSNSNDTSDKTRNVTDNIQHDDDKTPTSENNTPQTPASPPPKATTTSETPSRASTSLEEDWDTWE